MRTRRTSSRGHFTVNSIRNVSFRRIRVESLAIYQKHIGHETDAQITLHKAEKLQRAILKADEDQTAITAAAIAQLTSPVGEDKQDEERDRPTADDKGSTVADLQSDVCVFRRSVEKFRFAAERWIEEPIEPQQQIEQTEIG